MQKESETYQDYVNKIDFIRKRFIGKLKKFLDKGDEKSAQQMINTLNTHMKHNEPLTLPAFLAGQSEVIDTVNEYDIVMFQKYDSKIGYYLQYRFIKRAD